MSKFRRNILCPCGLGKKYKDCCAKFVRENSIFDLMNKKTLKIDESKLLHRILSSETGIEQTFDNECIDDITRISRYFGLAMYNITITLEREKHFDELTKTIMPLLMNLTSSIGASAELIRRGYFLEPGFIIRSVFERVSVIIFLKLDPEGLSKYNTKDFESSKTIGFSKKVIDVIGEGWGLLSTHLVHVSKLHKFPQLLKPYKKNDSGLKLNMSFLKLACWLYYVVSELICYDYIRLIKYWTKENHKIMFIPFENELLTAFDFVGYKFIKKVETRNI